jgi:hypothetical protein
MLATRFNQERADIGRIQKAEEGAYGVVMTVPLSGASDPGDAGRLVFFKLSWYSEFRMFGSAPLISGASGVPRIAARRLLVSDCGEDA